MSIESHQEIQEADEPKEERPLHSLHLTAEAVVIKPIAVIFSRSLLVLLQKHSKEEKRLNSDMFQMDTKEEALSLISTEPRNINGQKQ